jgi:hypothetical protein
MTSELAPDRPRDADVDARALDAIAHLLRDPEWSAGMLEDIAEIVVATGRDIEGDGAPTWERH